MKRVISAILILLLLAMLLPSPTRAAGGTITATETGDRNVPFANGYHGFCLDRGLHGAVTGNEFISTGNTSAATSNVDNSSISQKLKVLFTYCFEDIFEADGNGGYILNSMTANNIQAIVWSWTESYQYIWGDQKSLAEKVNTYSGPEIPDHGYTITRENGDVITFSFIVLQPMEEGIQDFFAYKLTKGTGKKEYPQLKKEVDKTTADMGSTVTYTLSTTVPKNTSGEIIVHDTMTGVRFDKLIAPMTGVSVNTAPAACCTVEFTIDSATVENGGEVEIRYEAIITADIANNEAYAQNGNYKTVPEEVRVSNYKVNVYKWTEGEDSTPVGLSSAGFVLMRGQFYYRYANGVVSWVTDINDASEYFSSAENNHTVTFVGLENGIYNLVEKTTPPGYNTIQNQSFQIKDADQIGSNQIAVENKAGTELPSTGGTGTVVFHVTGAVTVLIAAVLLISKKRMSAAE